MLPPYGEGMYISAGEAIPASRGRVENPPLRLGR